MVIRVSMPLSKHDLGRLSKSKKQLPIGSYFITPFSTAETSRMFRSQCPKTEKCFV